jgi:DNA-binding Lrp family transcriptional regulator
MMDDLDRAIINQLQGGFPLCDHPYASAAQQLGMSEDQLLTRLKRLLDDKVLTRFGPLYHAERMGGSLSLAAMKIPPQDFERVAGIVNALSEIAHNYAREHELNMWFVVATETPQLHQEAIKRIEYETGHAVYDMPKIKEYFVGLNLQV